MFRSNLVLADLSYADLTAESLDVSHTTNFTLFDADLIDSDLTNVNLTGALLLMQT